MKKLTNLKSKTRGEVANILVDEFPGVFYFYDEMKKDWKNEDYKEDYSPSFNEFMDNLKLRKGSLVSYEEDVTGEIQSATFETKEEMISYYEDLVEMNEN